MTKDEVLCKSLDKMRAKGVTAIKIELEAQLNREGDGRRRCSSCDEGEMTCLHCDSDGQEHCDDCDNSGVVGGEDCDTCDGTGYVSCSECDGEHTWECTSCEGEWQGRQDVYFGNTECLNFILGKLAASTNEQPQSEVYEDDLGDHDCAVVEQPFSWLHYANFYNDGSVDSELTFTVPIDSPEKVANIPKVLEAFKSLGDEVGNGLEVNGAGMHMAVLFSSDYSYPNDRSGLRSSQLNNFKNSMEQLLPALYFLGTTNETSRELCYRRPRVSVSSSDRYNMDQPKYSAVVHREGAIEFRVFDTCYDKPEAVLENIVVMANCLRYLSNTYINPNIHKITRALDFGNDTGRSIERFYQSATHIDVLNAGLERIKPSYYSITQLKQQRNFKLNKRKVNGLEKEQEAKASAAYQEYNQRYDWMIESRLSARRSTLLDEAIAEGAATPRRLAQIEQKLVERRALYEKERQTLGQYIKERVAIWKSENNGQYRLAFARES